MASTGIYLWTHHETGATLSGVAGAFVSGAVAGALSVVALPAFVGMAEAGVLLGITSGGLASVAGYGAGVVTENAVSGLTGTIGQASFTDQGASANLVGGMVGSAAGQVGTALYVGVESMVSGGLGSGLQAFSNSLRSIEANSTESTLVGLGVSAMSSSIATSYSQVSASLGQNQMVAWSSTLGYYAVDASSVTYDE